MMPAKDVEHLAKLAKLGVSKKDVAILRSQLSEILEYFKKINDVDTDGVNPTYHVQELVNVFREDEPKPLYSNELLGNVPKKKGRNIKAPKML